MADWGGFSEAELRHLRSGGDSKPTPQNQTNPKKTNQPIKKSTKKGLNAKKTTKPKTNPDAMLPTTTQPDPVKTSSEPEIEIKQTEKVKL